MDKKKVMPVLFVVCVIVATIYFRLLNIDTAFWYDEACSWFSAKQEFPMGIINNLIHLDLQHTPLYFFLLHFWMKIFGSSEVAIRSLSVIFGILTVPLVYIVSKKITSEKVAILSTLVVAVSPLLVFFSVEARMYPIVVFLVMLSLNYLVDFEQKNDKKSLIKLVLVNILIPYTLVGGILYNLSLALCYGIYLFKTKKDAFFLYLKELAVEFVLLIPYFILIGYYAKMRNLFVIKHEGKLVFAQIVDMIRNFFGLSIANNIYWPDVASYVITFSFSMLVIVPCVYFVYGLIQGGKTSKGFDRCLYAVFGLSLVLSIILAYFQVNVFTVRYILYLLPPMFILSLIGLERKISKKHLNVFVLYFVTCAIFTNIHYSKFAKVVKEQAFKAVLLESQRLNLGVDDMIIMPFGADAPYYFKTLNSPRVFEFDFHKEVRNPYNDKFYDKLQQKLMDKKARYGVVFDRIFDDDGFSEAHRNYFVEHVNNSIPQGHYVLLALYSTDSQNIVTVEDLRKSITSIQDIKNDILSVLFKKYLYDIRLYLDEDFNYLGDFSKDNYTYMLFQKR